jgi:hypothetical protein
MKLRWRWNYREQFRELKLADPVEALLHLLLLEEKLVGIFHVLPFASPAEAKMAASGFCPS